MPILDAHYKKGLAQLVAAGGLDINPTHLKTEFWAEIADFLPPTGRFQRRGVQTGFCWATALYAP